MSKGWTSMAAAGTLAFAASTAGAAVVNYNEAIGGDLPGSGALPTFAFDVGTNTVSGIFGSGANGSRDFDSFAFTVPGGARLVSAQVTLADLVGDIGGSGWDFNAGSATAGGGSFIESIGVLSPGTTIFGSTPRDAGLYNLSHASFGFIGAAPASSSYVFTFTLRPQVTEVPEPATAGLLGAALLGALAARRRRG